MVLGTHGPGCEPLVPLAGLIQKEPRALGGVLSSMPPVLLCGARSMLANAPRALLRRGCALLTTRRAFVTGVHLVKVRDVFDARIVLRAHPPECLQRLVDFSETLGRLSVHVS